MYNRKWFRLFIPSQTLSKHHNYQTTKSPMQSCCSLQPQSILLVKGGHWIGDFHHVCTHNDVTYFQRLGEFDMGRSNLLTGEVWWQVTLVLPSREPNRPLHTFIRNYQGKSKADCSHNAEKGKSYFPYITIILLLKLIRDKSYGTYITVILLLKAQVIDVSDAVHIYVISSYTRSMPTVFQLQYFLKKKCYYH